MRLRYSLDGDTQSTLPFHAGKLLLFKNEHCPHCGKTGHPALPLRDIPAIPVI